MNHKQGLDILDYTLRPSQVILNCLGMWPGEHRKSWRSRLKCFTAIFVLIYFSTLSQTIVLVKVWGDLNAVIDVLTTTDLPVTVVILKSTCFWYNGDVLNNLLVRMIQDWKNSKTAGEAKTMTYYSKLGRWTSLMIIYLPIACLSLQYVDTFSGTVREIKHLSSGSNGSEGVKPLFLNAKFFYDVQKTPAYEITYAMQAFSSGVAAAAFASVDAFFAVTVFHLCGQLSNLQQQMYELPTNGRSDKKSFIKLLSQMVSRHRHLDNFASLIENSFNLSFLAQMISSTIVLCLLGFQVVKLLTQQKIQFFEVAFMTYFSLVFMFSLFVYCYIAEVLRTKSVEVGDAVYESQWYDLPPANRKLLIMVMCRSRQPFVLTAGKFTVFSLELYAKILKTAGTYLSVLLAMQSRTVGRI